METKDRSKEAQKLINDKLSKYFDEKQLSYLDDLGIEILADYFSNRELRDLQDATPQILKGFVDRNQKNEVKRRLTQISEHELETIMPWYEENCSEIEEVYDPLAEVVIALEVKHKDMKNSPLVHWDGRFIVAIGDRLASTRTRLDGVVGYQSAVQAQDPSFVDTWSKFYDERDKKLKAYRARVEKTKVAHAKKVEKAQAAHQKAVDKYSEEVNNIRLKKGGKVPKVPIYVEPEYVGTAAFEEPERPVVEQYLPALDTRWSEIETEIIPEDHVMSSISNSDIVNVKRHIESTGYKKPVTKVKDGYKVDQFILRKVK